MCFDDVGFLVDWALLLLLLAKLFDQSHGLTLKTTANFPPDTAREQFHKLFIVHVKELIQVNTPVGELTESPLFLELDGGGFVSHFDVFQANLEGKKKKK